MSYFLPEPPFQHDLPSRIGVLLINLGTPAAPTASALRPYLKEFLSDRRVVEIPRAIWWLILNGIILNTRPRKSAEKYASIWQNEGSPLKIHTEALSRALQIELARRIPYPIQVEHAMRYGQPDVAGAMQRLKAAGCDRLLVVPLYPQYAASSAATALDAVYRTLLRTRNMPALRTVRHYHDHPGYIAALKTSVEAYWAEHGRPKVLVMSFHGVPRYTLDKGDPYHCECHKTGRLLAEALGLAKDEYRIAFQSRFGRTEWLKPYTSEVLEELGRAGMRRIDTLCPGFAADCLETLEEIAMEGKTSFLNAGGGEYHYIPALNTRPDWVAALADITLEQLPGWLPAGWDSATEQQDLQIRTERARGLGARN
jgi:ferrochelatase